MDVAEMIGLVAGLLTTLAYVPQAAKTWQAGTARGFSLPMLVMLVAGVALWMVSGLLKGSLSLTLANAITLMLSGSILFVKLRHG